MPFFVNNEHCLVQLIGYTYSSILVIEVFFPACDLGTLITAVTDYGRLSAKYLS